MDVHICVLCSPDSRPILSTTDVTLRLALPNEARIVVYDVSAMAPHYAEAHQWTPPAEFVFAVMNGRAVHQDVPGVEIFNRGRVGYVQGVFPRTSVPKGFAAKLRERMAEARYLVGHEKAHLS